MATMFLCLICSETFPDVKALAAHMVAHQFAPLGQLLSPPKGKLYATGVVEEWG